VLSGDALSQWLQRQHTGVVQGSLVRLTSAGLPQVSSAADSHAIRVLLPVLRGGQAAVARAVVDGTQSPELALRVQAVSSQAERVRQMQRLVTMLTVAEKTRAEPARYPAVLAVLESFVLTVPADQLPAASRVTQHELWCDVMPWCRTSLSSARDDVLAAGPSAAIARLLPLVLTVHAVHEDLNVVHRDITPNNVLVDSAGRLLLADWGIAHTVAAGQTSTRTELVGNRGFSLPPEMLAGDQGVGRYTDAWYLGSLLVWLFTGTPPGPQHGTGWLPGGLPTGAAGAELERVARGLCAEDPHRRTGLAEAGFRLDRLRHARPSDWGPPAAPAQPAPSSATSHTGSRTVTSPAAPASPAVVRQWSKFWWPVAAAVAVAVVAVGVLVGWRAMHSTKEPATASTPTECWDDLSAGRCPDIPALSLGTAFPVQPEVRPPLCGDQDIDYESSPGDPGPNWLISCEWPGENGNESRFVYLQWFRDAEAIAEHYRIHDMPENIEDAPVFPNRPDGPVYFREVNTGVMVAYCYSVIPVCLETEGGMDVVERTLARFLSLTDREALRLAESVSS